MVSVRVEMQADDDVEPVPLVVSPAGHAVSVVCPVLET
jgi:hypothetical protein